MLPLQVERSLEALLKVGSMRLALRGNWLYVQQVEESKAKAAEDEASAAKQKLLNIEKQKIRDLVREAFDPLKARLRTA